MNWFPRLWFAWHEQKGSGGSQIAAAMAILFFTGILCGHGAGEKPSKPPIPHCGTKRL
jgi:hypothetical protein